MVNIGIIGAGQMGSYYLRNLVEKKSIPARDISIFDIDSQKTSALAAKYEGLMIADSLADLSHRAQIFIVAVNTPAHYEVIETLARHGARRVLRESGIQSILSEKPLAPNLVDLRKIRALERKYTNVQISTAFVIAFSPTRIALTELMAKEDLVLRVFGGRWGKNRGSAKELRPTAGDLVDEFVHMSEFGLGLLPSSRIDYVDVSAQVGYLKYVNVQAQQRAHERDPSFPLVPDHSTQALFDVKLVGGETTQMSMSSSFLEAKQVRQVWGTLCRPTNEPMYSFAIDFDANGEDILTLTHIREDTVEEKRFREDKLLSLTDAFLTSATSTARDSRLADVAWAGKFVELMEAIGASDRRRLAGKSRDCRVQFRSRNWLGLRSA